MSGEKSVKSGSDGEKIVSELLKLMGWVMAGNIQYPCTKGDTHKEKSKVRKTHNIDGLYQYHNPLIHNNYDVALISVKHKSNGYSSNKKKEVNDAIRHLGQCIECGKNLEKEGLLNHTSKRPNFIGMLFYISSLPDESGYDLIAELQDSLVSPRLGYNTIYIIDNKKATFLTSVLKTAFQFNPLAKLEFLYHDIGYNDSPEELYVSSKIMPIELMNSSLIPIVLHEGTSSSLLLFTNIGFNKDYLKKIIWLTHKLCNLANKIVIYFPDYDTTKHERLVDSTKSIFNDSELVDRITVRRITEYSFITLKEDQNKIQLHPKTFDDYRIEKKKSTQIVSSTDNINLLLPYGSRLKQLIATSKLTPTNLRDFLKSKGVLTKSSEKKYTIPILSSMLLNPLEIDVIREVLIEQEDKPKSITEIAKWADDSLDFNNAIFDLKIDDFLSQLEIPSNVEFLNSPILKNPRTNFFEIPILIKRENTTKDLIVGETHHSAAVLLYKTEEKSNIHIKVEYTAPETKKICTQISSIINTRLLEKKMITAKAKSILFSDFSDNTERIGFLLSFKDVKASEYFFNGRLQNIKFKPDERATQLPKELEPMKNKVTNLDINGDDLDSLTYVTDELYRQTILLERVKVKYAFKFQDNEGECITTIGFPSTLNSKKVDFYTILETKVEFPKGIKSNRFSWKKDRLITALSRKLDDLVLAKYHKSHRKKE